MTAWMSVNIAVVPPNPEGQGQHGGGGEHRRMPELPERVTKIAE